MEDMNKRETFYDIKSFYNRKAKLKASCKGMRYQVEQVDSGDAGKKLRAYVWPEPFCFEKTPDVYKQSEEFEYSEDGLDAAYKWVCGCYMEQKDRWGYAAKFPLDMAKKMGLAGNS